MMFMCATPSGRGYCQYSWLKRRQATSLISCALILMITLQQQQHVAATRQTNRAAGVATTGVAEYADVVAKYAADAETTHNYYRSNSNAPATLSTYANYFAASQPEALLTRDNRAELRAATRTSGFMPTTLSAAGQHYTAAGGNMLPSSAYSSSSAAAAAAASSLLLGESFKLPAGDKIDYEINAENYNDADVATLEELKHPQQQQQQSFNRAQVPAQQQEEEQQHFDELSDYLHAYPAESAPYLNDYHVEPFSNYQQHARAYGDDSNSDMFLPQSVTFKMQDVAVDKAHYKDNAEHKLKLQLATYKAAAEAATSAETDYFVKQEQHQHFETDEQPHKRQQYHHHLHQPHQHHHHHHRHQQEEQQQQLAQPSQRQLQIADSEGRAIATSHHVHDNENPDRSVDPTSYYYHQDQENHIEQHAPQYASNLQLLQQQMQQQQEQFHELQLQLQQHGVQLQQHQHQKQFTISPQIHQLQHAPPPPLPPITSTVHHTPASAAAIHDIPLGKHVHITKNVPTLAQYQQQHVPFKQAVPIEIPHPVITTVPRPYPIRIPMPKTVAVPVLKEVKIPIEKIKPFPVERRIPYIVERRVPYRVEKQVATPVYYPYPIKVPIVKTIVHRIPAARHHASPHHPHYAQHRVDLTRHHNLLGHNSEVF